jgi:flagellar biosynthetic protein FliR
MIGPNIATLMALLVSSSRVLAWISIAPPFGTAGMPMVIKPMVAVALSLAVLPAEVAHAPGTDVASIGGAILLNVAVGAGLGFGTRLIFTAVEAAGSLIDVFGGFSLAFDLDPLSKAQNSVFGRFYGLMLTTLLFATQAHLMIIAGFMRSFQSIPIDGGVSLSDLGHSLVSATTNMFLAAMQIAGPLIVVLFVADIALGLMNRIAPQLNVFSISFPLKILLTLALVGFTFFMLPDTVQRLTEQALSFMGGIGTG